MRAFWIVVGVLMLAASGYLFYKAPAGLPPEQVQPEMRVARAEPPPPARPIVREEPAPAPKREEPSAGAEAKPAPREERPAELQAETKPTETGPAEQKTEPAPEAAKPIAETKPAATEVAGPAVAAPERAAEPAPAPAPAPVNTEASAPAAPEAAEPKIVRNEDGSMVVDGKFRMRGSGTAEDPYTVTWDQLTSIQDDYAPKDGREVIPPRIRMLDGKHVRIEGNIAFPMMMDEAEECLVMLNQWDGCCIGVPPTPYDAVEVKLKDVVSGDARMTTYGSITGKLKVDPHLVGGWLVGLYVMEQATLKPQAYGGFAP